MSPSRFDHLPNLATIPSPAAPVPPELDEGIVDVTEDTIADRDVVESARKHIASLREGGDA